MFVHILLFLVLSAQVKGDANEVEPDFEDDISRAVERGLSGGTTATNTTTTSSTGTSTYTTSATEPSSTTISFTSSTMSTATTSSSTMTTATTTSSTDTTQTSTSSTQTITSFTTTSSTSTASSTSTNTTTSVTETSTSFTSSSTTATFTSTSSSTTISTTNTTTSSTETSTTTYTGLWYEVLAKSYVGILTGNAYRLDEKANEGAATTIGALVSVVYTSATLVLPEEGSTVATFVVEIRSFRRSIEAAREEATRLSTVLDALTPSEVTGKMRSMDSLTRFAIICTDLDFSMEILYPNNANIEVYRSVGSSTSSSEPPESVSDSANGDYHLLGLLLAWSFVIAG